MRKHSSAPAHVNATPTLPLFPSTFPNSSRITDAQRKLNPLSISLDPFISDPRPLQKPSSRPGYIERLGTPEPIVAYDRDLYGYESYPTYAKSGFYTGRSCDTNIDHVVSLKDAHESGAGRWTPAERGVFSNDRLNHVPSCKRINSSKGSSTPSDFLRKSSDGRGMEYEIKPKCAYLGIYYQVKRKYRLSFQNNDSSLFSSCGLEID